jgi:TetR/AcrR family transcriptional regulator
MNVTTQRREREKEERREALIDAAERVFDTRGRSAVTMDDVAMEAQYSKGLLYKYFQNKDDLFEAVSLRGHRRLLAMFEEAVASGETGLQQISAIGRAYIRFAKAYPVYFEALVAHSTGEPSLDTQTYSAMTERAADEILRLVQDVIQRGVDDGSLRPNLDVAQTAFLLWGALHGLVVTATFKNVLGRHDLEPERFLRESLQFLATCMRP